MKEAWGNDTRLVIAGLTNTYASYITTFEEYGVQRYEGASTLYGPHTLDAYIQVWKSVLCFPPSVPCQPILTPQRHKGASMP